MQRILCIELLGGLGDVLIALPAIQALADTYPNAHLSVLTFVPGSDLLRHHPLIQDVIAIPKGTARAAVEQQLQQTYDLVVSDTTYDGIAELIRHSSASRVVTNLWRNPPPDQNVSDRFLQILLDENLITPAAAERQRYPHIHLTQTERTTAQGQLGAAYRPLICLYPDAGMAIKRWSPDYFVTLGRLLQERYGASLVIPDGVDPSSANVTDAIAQALTSVIRWPKGSLRQLAALFSQVDCAIAADTGPIRIAAALGVPTVTLFGPSWKGRYGQPLPHVNLQGYPGCPERNIANFTEQSCWYSGECPFEWDTCVDLIAPEEVVDAIAPLIRSGYINIETDNNPNQPISVGAHYYASSFSHVHLTDLKDDGLRDRTHSSAPQQTGYTLPPWLVEGRSPRNILAMRLDNIGDVLMTSPALRAIKQQHPDTRLTLMTSPAGALTAPLMPWVDEVLPWRVLWQDLGRLSFDPQREWDLIHTLRAQQFDAAIIFTSFKQSPHPAAWVCQMASMPLILGESKEMDIALTHAIAPAPDALHQVERNLRLVESVGYTVGDRQLALAVLPSPLIPKFPYLLLNPWTSCQSRTYSIQRFAIAARTLSTLTGYPVVVTGVEKDREHATELLNMLGDRAIDYIGKTSLSDLVALIAHAELMLSNNTSTMHIADATQTPSVILFAGTELECQWHPRQTSAILLRRPTTCSPCYQFTCPYQLECLDIEPDAVVAAALSLLQPQMAPRSLKPTVNVWSERV